MSLATFRARVTNGIVVWTLATAFLGATVGLVSPPAAAQNCDRSGGPTAGDWNIGVGDNQLCVGIVIVMDGNLNINQGSLTIRDGGLKFVQDTGHVYQISVTASGDLTFETSQLWTETKTINPYMKLAVSISGAGSTLTLTDSTFAFPGTLNVTGPTVSATFTRSTITGTTANLGSVFSSDSVIRDNDDAPGLTFSSSTVTFFGGRVEKLYENSDLTGSDPRQSIRLIGATTMTAIDTFLAIDVNNNPDDHNTLALADTSNAYLYGISTDPEANGNDQDTWTSPITTTGTARADIYRWANARVVDVNGVPVSGADINAEFAGPESGLATFRDNGVGATDPPPNVLGYMGKTAATWDDTGVDGLAHMPLLSDWIDAATMPNSRFVGTFNLHATAPTLQTGDAGLTFDTYPLMLAANAQKSATITISTLTLPLPDLVPVQPTFVPATPLEGDTVDITAPIANQGAGGAANVLVHVFDGVTLLSQQTIPFIAAGGQQSVTATLVYATAGSHVILVRVDPNDDITEGPGAGAETNNEGGFPLPVTRLGPDLAIQLTFSPAPGFLNNPVRLDGAVTNVGDRSASSVAVAFYMQAAAPDDTSTPIGIATIPFVNANGTATASINWTATSTGSFTFWAWADYQDQIPEPLPYDNLVNNKDQNTLVVGPAPDLVVFDQDLTMRDPFPQVNATGTIEAVIRNAGQAPAGAFRTDFFLDGVFQTSTFHGGLAVGARVIATAAIASLGACGSHTVSVLVDAANPPLGQVNEGPLYEQNNFVTQSVQVYPGGPANVLTWSGGTITADQAVSKSIEIDGAVTVSDARIDVVQDQDPCGRYYVKVLSTGSLTLNNATLESNWPLVVFIAGPVPGPGGTLTATDSTFNLDLQGKGVLHSKGTLTLRSSTISGDVVAKGTTADLRGDTFQGTLLHIDTTARSRLWDASLAAVETIELSSDAPGAGAVDFDIRNVTFNAGQTNQLVFFGDQWVQLTSVTLTKPGDWWTGMATQSAHITRYWWLTVWTVDGTGTPIIDPTVNVTLEQFNPTGPTPGWGLAPTCAADECYFNTSPPTAWPVNIPQGRLLYRARAEDRYGNLPPEVRATYRASGSAFIEGSLRVPDQPVDGLVEADGSLILTFSELTPDLSIDTVVFNGGNGNNLDFQPLNRELTIVATVNNTGEIITRNVFVYFYSADVDSDRDGYVDDPHSLYVQTNTFIGSAGPFNVSALSTRVFTVTWTPIGAVEGARIVSAVVDPSTGPDPRSGGNLSELNEVNNLNIRTMTAFIWADLHLDRNEQWALVPPVPIAFNQIQISFNVVNQGTSAATDVTFGVYGTANNSLGPEVILDVGRGTTLRVNVIWQTGTAAPTTIRIRAIASGTPGTDPVLRRNVDYDEADSPSDNFVDNTYVVQTQPELSLVVVPPLPSPFRNQRFNLTVNVTNTGGTQAFGVVVRVTDVTTVASPVILGSITIDVAPGFVIGTIANLQGITASGGRMLNVTVDADDTVTETNELNNVQTVTITIQAPSGEVRFQTPTDRQEFRQGALISVLGRVVETTSSAPIPNVRVTAELVNPATQAVLANTTRVSNVNDGGFLIPVSIPEALPDGTYILRLNAEDASITDAEISILIRVPLNWWEVPVVGLPLWIWLIVIIGAIAAIGGGTAYVKFVGLGKLVECGECGAFIPEDSAACPKCGVEFEKDMAKCSNCQAWIPADVKQCPECGVEFATGEVQIADYDAKMRQQYDEVTRRYREEASQELGRQLTEKEFEDWWRTQPTFLTFEDWLREEEEMRRMGSKPCPVCKTPNSVTATVCHKCGTLLKERERPRGGGPQPPTRPVSPVSQPRPSGAAEEGAEAGMPYGEVPKKVVKKPVGAPVVQKKVIKRPLEEKEEDGTEGEQDQI